MAVRTSLVLPKSVDQYVSCLSSLNSQSKNAFIVEILCNFLKSQGFDPMSSEPRIVSSSKGEPA